MVEVEKLRAEIDYLTRENDEIRLERGSLLKAEKRLAASERERENLASQLARLRTPSARESRALEADFAGAGSAPFTSRRGPGAADSARTSETDAVRDSASKRVAKDAGASAIDEIRQENEKLHKDLSRLRQQFAMVSKLASSK